MMSDTQTKVFCIPLANLAALEQHYTSDAWAEIGRGA